MNTGPTPGPWKTVRSLYSKGHLCVQLGTDELYTTSELRPEDAHLIAAAPDLVAACAEMHTAIDTLFALLILHLPGFKPSESGQPWAALTLGMLARRKGRGGGI